MWDTFQRCIFICLSLTCADALVIHRGPSDAKSASKPTSFVLGEHDALLGVRKAPPLVPRAGSSSFKVLQLADVHLGEDFDGDWGPEQDRKTMAVVEALLDNEKPDLVVFSGDQLTGEGLRGNASRREVLLNKLEEPLKKRGVPWATIFGNHDACDKPGCRTAPGNSRNVLLLSGKHKAPTQEEVDKAHEELVGSMKKQLIDIIVRPKESTGAPSSAPGAAQPPASIAVASPASAPPTAETSIATAPAAAAPPVVAPPVTPAAAAPAAAAPAAPMEIVGDDEDQDQMTVLHALQPHSFLRAGNQASLSGHSGGVVQDLVTHGTGNGWREKYLQHEFASSLSRTGIDGMFESSGGGKSNYWLKVFDSSEDAKADQPSFLLWFIDTGGGELSEALDADQLDWLSRESSALEARYGPLPGALYAHIPLQEFGQVEPGQQSTSCNGVSDDSVTPVQAGMNLFPLLSKMHISWVFSGHNHGNDWCCRVSLASSTVGNALKQPDIELCYGRHSGYGGYSTPGLHLRGARVFELHPGMAKRFLRGQASDSGVESWVRLEDGSKGPHWSEKP